VLIVLSLISDPSRSDYKYEESDFSSMRKMKSINELYNEIKDFDLVITNDAALSTALNGRIDTARIGGFAYTPRHIAGHESLKTIGSGIWGDLKIISAIAEETGYNIKFIHSELENIRTIRRFTKEVTKYLYSKRSKRVYDSFIYLPTIEKVMGSYVPEDHEFFKGKRTAVIGIELFDDLDKHFIPLDHEEIDMFDGGKYSVDTIYEVGNDRQLAENTVGLVDQTLANNTAIVMDTSGPIADAVRAALYRNNIPFRNTMSVRDLSQVRDYLQFLSLGLSYDTLRVKHVRELFSSYRGYLDHKLNDYLLSKVSFDFRGRTKELNDVMRDIRTLSFQEVNERIVGKEHRPQIKILVDDLKISGSLITSKLVNEIIYAVNNINDLHHNEEIPDDEKKGVLLVDCKRSVYVDRPFVIYLGMGPEWSGAIVGKEYIDREAEAEINMLRFTALLQQGITNLYAVNSMRGGRESVPSPIFDQISEWESFGEDRTPITSFGDVCSNLVKGQWSVPKPPAATPTTEIFIEETKVRDWKFSKSTYNSYHFCPRAYMFNRIIPIADSESTVFGSIIHEFAEFYLCYPGLAKKNIEECINIIESRYSGLSSNQMKDIDNSRARICINNVIKFIDRLNIKNVPLDRECSMRRWKNGFMEEFGCEMYSSMTETEFTSKLHPLTGNFDLVLGDNIIDYKTGKPNDLKKISGKMDLSKDQDYYEFQAMVYLSLLKDNGVGPPCRFSLFYVGDNIVRSATVENFNIGENIRDVVLMNESSKEFLSRSDSPVKDVLGASYNILKDNWGSFTDKIISFGLEKGGEWADSEDLISSILSSLGLNDNKTNRKTVTGGLKAVYKIIKTGTFAIQNELLIPSDTLEKFLTLIDSSHEKASYQEYSSFPPEPKGSCKKCNFFKACTRDPVELDEEVFDE